VLIIFTFYRTYLSTRFNHKDQFTFFLLGKLSQQQIVALLQRKLTHSRGLEKSAEPLDSVPKTFAKETIQFTQATNKKLTKLHVVSPS